MHKTSPEGHLTRSKSCPGKTQGQHKCILLDHFYNYMSALPLSLQYPMSVCFLVHFLLLPLSFVSFPNVLYSGQCLFFWHSQVRHKQTLRLFLYIQRAYYVPRCSQPLLFISNCLIVTFALNADSGAICQLVCNDQADGFNNRHIL